MYFLVGVSRSSRPKMFCKKCVLRNFTKLTEKHLCQSLFFNKVSDFKPTTLLKKVTLAQVFSCELCEISKNTFFDRIPRVVAFKFQALSFRKPKLLYFSQIGNVFKKCHSCPQKFDKNLAVIICSKFNELSKFFFN